MYRSSGFDRHTTVGSGFGLKPFVRPTVKRIFDFVVAVSLIIFLLPIFVIIALLLKLTSRGPIFFRQERYGLNKKKFTIYKFRTMTPEACASQFAQAVKSDTRVTVFGQFLRRTSLDELPQFINVLKGDMSIVGPRPHAVEMDELLSETVRHYDERFSVKPGITGLSQSTGFRGPTVTSRDIIGRIARDRFYIRNQSLILDIMIVLRTARVMWFGNAF